MEKYNAIVQAVSTVGFPIMIALILIYVIWKIEENHKTEMNSMITAVTNNTLVLQKLVDKIDTLSDRKA